MSDLAGGAASGPRRLDPHQQGKVQEQTLVRYRGAAQPFVRWLEENGFFPQTASEWDDLLVEFKNATNLTRPAFEQLVSCVEFVHPRYKGELSWAHAVIKGMHTTGSVKHATPLCSAAAAWVATTWASEGAARLGLGLYLQTRCGLRPSEMLRICPCDLSPPSELQNNLVIGLGTRVGGTKVKRPQFAIVRASVDDRLIRLTLRVASATPYDRPLFPFTSDLLRRWLKRFETARGLNAGWTAHSPRAGYATDGVAEGKDILTIKEGGRWLSESSFRTYVDVVASTSVLQDIQRLGFAPALRFCSEHFERYFVVQCFDAPYRLEEVAGRHVPAAYRGAAATAAAGRAPGGITCVGGSVSQR